MSDLTELLKDMDKEFGGGYEIEDGTYWATLDIAGSKMYEPEDPNKESAFILQWRIDGGDMNGKTPSEFIRWHTADEKTARIRHSVLTTMVRGVSLAVSEDTHPEIQEAYVALLQSTGAEEGLEAVQALVTSFGEVRMPIRLVTKTSNGRDFQNIKYLERGGAVVATDARQVSAVNV
jgi:hypothetical protein